MFCVFCGEKKRLTWPKYDKLACSQKCAAGWALGDYWAGPDTHYCIECGEGGGGHTNTCIEANESQSEHSPFVEEYE